MLYVAGCYLVSMGSCYLLYVCCRINDSNVGQNFGQKLLKQLRCFITLMVY